MKWLFALLLALVIFLGAAFFSYNILFKQEIAVRHEQRGDVTPAPTPDISLPEFQAAAKLRQEDKLTEARDALSVFIQKYPTDLHAEEAKDLLGEVNIDILLSRTPSPEKTDYVVKSGDVLAVISRRLKTTPELIMRMNNLSGTMLHIGEHLLISHPDFAIVIQREAGGATQSRRVLQAISRARGEAVAQTAGESHDKSRGNNGLARWQTRRVRNQGVSREHALDPARCGRLHALFGGRFSPSRSYSAAVSARPALARFYTLGIERPCTLSAHAQRRPVL